jgi:hypothetical protein
MIKFELSNFHALEIIMEARYSILSRTVFTSNVISLLA